MSKARYRKVTKSGKQDDETSRYNANKKQFEVITQEEDDEQPRED